jgi:hypothetical protein
MHGGGRLAAGCPLVSTTGLIVTLGTIMARWPENSWTTLVTYGLVLVMFPVLALLAYAWVQGWLPF